MQHWNRFGKPETMKFRTSYCTTKPSFSDASSALFSHVLYTRLNMPCLILRFSSAEPFRADDTPVGNMERIICFDHRESVVSRNQPLEECPESLEFQVDVGKSSSSGAYECFASKLGDMSPSDYDSFINYLCTLGECVSLLSLEDRERVEPVLEYIEDGDLQQWSLPDMKAFDLGNKG
uniref:Uncharacterized protein n=1 Tax=Kalanchoe fedtschenkoi TaxID=63787 RepID=A0A7N0TN71_KALFE